MSWVEIWIQQSVWEVSFTCHRHFIPCPPTVHSTLITTDACCSTPEITFDDWLRGPPTTLNGQLRCPTPVVTSANFGDHRLRATPTTPNYQCWRRTPTTFDNGNHSTNFDNHYLNYNYYKFGFCWHTNFLFCWRSLIRFPPILFAELLNILDLLLWPQLIRFQDDNERSYYKNFLGKIPSIIFNIIFKMGKLEDSVRNS